MYVEADDQSALEVTDTQPVFNCNPRLKKYMFKEIMWAQW